MTIDWWGLGLQAVNVLILVWLLSRVFWRPVAAAIAKRKDAAKAIMDDARTAQDKANSALAEVTKTRAGIAAERETILAEATAAAETAAKAAATAAAAKADKLADAARRAIAHDTEVARKENAASAAALSVEIAAKVLAQLDTQAVHVAFLALLLEAIKGMAEAERVALAGTATGVDLVSAADFTEPQRAKITKAVSIALGGAPKLNFVTDAGLIAGLELRTPHFVLHNSWQADLAGILKDLKHAA